MLLGLPFLGGGGGGHRGRTAGGLVMERVAYRPLRGAHEVAMLLTSFSVTIFLENLAIILFRPTSRPFPAPALLRERHRDRAGCVLPAWTSLPSSLRRCSCLPASPSS